MRKAGRWLAALATALMLCGGGTRMAAQAKTEQIQINHAYVPYEWCRTVASEEVMNERLDELQRHGIDVLLCDIGCYRMMSETDLSNTIAYDNLGAWIAKGHERGMTVLACINYAISDYTNGEMAGTNGTYDDYIREDMRRISEIFTKTGVEYNGRKYVADGVQMDVEPFRRPYQEQLMRIMRTVRETIGDEKMLSMATPAKNGAWSDAYATEIIELMDMLCPMVYDTVGPVSWGNVSSGVSRTKAEYIEIAKRTCLWYSDLIQKSDNTDCILAITAPVYEDRLTASDIGYPDADSNCVYYHLNYNKLTGETQETLENCLLGVLEAMDEGAKVDGAGVFYWPSFVGESQRYQPTINPYYDYNADQQAWKTLWLGAEDDTPVNTTTAMTTTASKKNTTTTEGQTTAPTTKKEPVGENTTATLEDITPTTLPVASTPMDENTTAPTTSGTKKEPVGENTMATLEDITPMTSSVASTPMDENGSTVSPDVTATTTTSTGTSISAGATDETGVTTTLSTTTSPNEEEDDTGLKTALWAAAAAVVAGGIAAGAIALWRKHRKTKNL